MAGFFTYLYEFGSTLATLTLMSSSPSSSSSSSSSDAALLRNINYTMIALVVVYVMSNIMTWIKRVLWACFFIQIFQLVEYHIATSDIVVGIMNDYLGDYNIYIQNMRQMISPFVEQLKVLFINGIDSTKTAIEYCNDMFQEMMKEPKWSL